MKTAISGRKAGDGGEIIVDVKPPDCLMRLNFFIGNSQNNLDITKKDLNIKKNSFTIEEINKNDYLCGWEVDFFNIFVILGDLGRNVYR